MPSPIRLVAKPTCKIPGRHKIRRIFLLSTIVGICMSQNVQVNIYYNSANEHLCVSELLCQSNMDLFAFLTVIWQHSQWLNLRSRCTSAANLWDLDLSTALSYNCWMYRFIVIFGLASLVSLTLEPIAILAIVNIYSLYGVTCFFISYAAD